MKSAMWTKAKRSNAKRSITPVFAICLLSVLAVDSVAAVPPSTKIENAKLVIESNQKAGTYTIRSKENPRVWITAAVAAQVNHRWLRSSDYPQHEIRESSFNDALGAGSQLSIAYSGLT